MGIPGVPTSIEHFADGLGQPAELDIDKPAHVALAVAPEWLGAGPFRRRWISPMPYVATTTKVVDEFLIRGARHGSQSCSSRSTSDWDQDASEGSGSWRIVPEKREVDVPIAGVSPPVSVAVSLIWIKDRWTVVAGVGHVVGIGIVITAGERLVGLCPDKQERAETRIELAQVAPFLIKIIFEHLLIGLGELFALLVAIPNFELALETKIPILLFQDLA